MIIDLTPSKRLITNKEKLFIILLKTVAVGSVTFFE